MAILRLGCWFFFFFFNSHSLFSLLVFCFVLFCFCFVLFCFAFVLFCFAFFFVCSFVCVFICLFRIHPSHFCPVWLWREKIPAKNSMQLAPDAFAKWKQFTKVSLPCQKQSFSQLAIEIKQNWARLISYSLSFRKTYGQDAFNKCSSSVLAVGKIRKVYLHWRERRANWKSGILEGLFVALL